MSFKEFDLTDYINVLEDFKKKNTETIIKYWGNIESFDLFVNKVKEDEDKVAKLAIQQYGSVEKYTEEMRHNLEHFSEIIDSQMTDEVKEIAQQSNDLYVKLTANLFLDFTSDEIQSVVHEIDLFMCKHTTASISINKDLWEGMIHSYSTDYTKAITDTKYGSGAADYIANAFQYYIKNRSD